VTQVFKVHPQCMYHGLSIKQPGLLTNGKEINWSNLKKKSLPVHREITKKLIEMFKECFIYVN